MRGNFRTLGDFFFLGAFDFFFFAAAAMALVTTWGGSGVLRATFLFAMMMIFSLILG